MFSKVVSLVKTSARGLSPKAWLASAIAQALNEFFVLDHTQDIESNLVTDTKIILHNVQVRPRPCSDNACLYGTIEQVELSWTWGGSNKNSSTSGSGGSSFVRDTRLTIRGAKFQILVGPSTATATESITTADATGADTFETSQNAAPSSSSSYLQRTLQQIMDHLTLNITNFSLSVVAQKDGASFKDKDDISSNSNDIIQNIHHSLCVAVTGLQLVSFGRQDRQNNDETSTVTSADSSVPPAPPLMQRVSLESISAVLKPTNEQQETLPLLDPIGYAASVKRVSGRRFLDGWATGLEVVGEVLGQHCGAKNTNTDFVVYAGVAQMKTLAQFANLLDAPRRTQTSSKQPVATFPPGFIEETTEDLITKEESFFDSLEELGSLNDGDEEAKEKEESNPTTILLPLPSITLMLPHKSTHLSMPGCTYAYHVDGSICRLYGSHGIRIGQTPFLQFGSNYINEADNESGWMVDWANYQVTLHQGTATTEGSQGTALTVEWDDAEMKTAIQGLQEIFTSMPRHTVEQVETAIEDYSAAHTTLAQEQQLQQEGQQDGPNWRFDSNGSISMKVTCQSDWVQATLAPLSFELSSNASNGLPISQFALAGATIGPCSFGDSGASLIKIPALQLQEMDSWVMQGVVDATLESKEVANSLQSLWNQVIDFPELEHPSSKKKLDFSSTLSGAKDGNASSPAAAYPPLTIQGVKMQLLSESYKLLLANLKMGVKSGQDQSQEQKVFLNCAKIKATGKTKQEAISLHGLSASWGVATRVLDASVQEIDKVGIPGVVENLEQPICNVRFRFQSKGSGCLKLEVPTTISANLSSSLLDEDEASAKNEPQALPTAPFVVEARFSEIKLALASEKSLVSRVVLGATTVGTSGSQEKEGIINLNVGAVQGWLSDAGDDKNLSMSGLSASIGLATKDLNVKIQRIDNVYVPGTIDALREPILDTTIHLGGEAGANLHIDVQSAIKAVVSPVLIGDAQQLQTKQLGSGSTSVDSSFALPFPVQLRIKELNLMTVSTESLACIQPFNISVKECSSGAKNNVAVCFSEQPTTVRVINSMSIDDNSWVQASLAGSSKFVVCTSSASGPQVASFDCGGVYLGPSSLGNIAVSIPAFSFNASTAGSQRLPKVQVDGMITADIHSVAVIQKIQQMLQRATGYSPGDKASASPSNSSAPILDAEVYIPSLKVQVRHPKPAEATLQTLHMQSNQISLAEATLSVPNSGTAFGSLSLSFFGAKGMATSDFRSFGLILQTATVSGSKGLGVEIAGVTTTWESTGAVDATFTRIEKLCIPDAFELLEPASDVSVKLADSLMDVKITTNVKGVCPLLNHPQEPPPEVAAESAGVLGGLTAPTLPFPVRIKVTELKLQSSKTTDAWLALSPVDLAVVPMEQSLSLKCIEACVVRLQADKSDDWVQASFGPASCMLNPSFSGNFTPSSGLCDSISIGPCSFGQLKCNIPALKLATNQIEVMGDVAGTLESTDMVQQIQKLWEQFFPSKEPSTSLMPYALKIPRAVVEIYAMKAKAVAETIFVDGVNNVVSSGRFGFQDTTGTAAAFSGLNAKIFPVLDADMQAVDAFYIPGMCGLEKPVQGPLKISFDSGGALSVFMPPVDLLVYASSPGQSATDTGAKPFSETVLPFPVRLNLQQMNVRSFTTDGEVSTISQLAFHMEPQAKDPFGGPDAPQGVLFGAVVSQMENKLLKLTRTKASGLVFNGDLSSIHNFRLMTEPVTVAAGFSSVDWAGIFGSQESHEASIPIALPLASVEPFLVRLAYTGKLLGVQNTKVSVPKFQGSYETDSKELLKHVKQAVISRVPAMLTNMEFMGASVTEMAATNAGRAVMATSVTGALAGSVVGLVAQDSVRGAVIAGKQSRGAESGESYRFGDFTRGMAHSVRQSAKSGGQQRRGSSDSYQVGDFTIGASRSIGKYSSENKERLGSAGVAGVGMIVGGAFLGPVGVVAGSYIGTKIGGGVMGGKKKDEPPARQETTEGIQSARAPPTQAFQQSPQPHPLSGTAQHQAYMPPPTAAALPVETIQKQHREGCGAYHAPNGAGDPQPNYGQQQQQMRQQQQQQFGQQQQQFCQQQQRHQHQQQQQQGYRFGDLTRSVVARGKEKRGGSSSDGYKFGDFTKGLFGS